MPEVHLNGKWLGQPFTGVQRYSEEVASRVAAAEDFDFVLHVPKGATAPAWATKASVRVRVAPVAGVMYEQLYLPLATRGRLLLSFGGIPPILKRRQVVTFHDATPFRFPRTFRFLFVAYYFIGFFILSRTAYQLLTVSEFSRNELAEFLRVSPTRFLVVPCGADLLEKVESRQPEMPCQESAYLVVGTLARHKNLAAPVEALAASGRRVTVVGAAGLASVFANYVPSFGPLVTVARRLTDSELRWLYEHSQALVFPSFYEGFGIPVLEAQTLRCPAISSRTASIPSVAADGSL
jgi:glycosyltransferase involved in cell wall biosynthesis